MKEKKERAKRLPTFAESITSIVAMLLILTIGKGVFGYSTEPLLIMVAAIAAFIAFRVGITWDEMMDEICTKIAKGHACHPDSGMCWRYGWYLDGIWYHSDDDLLWRPDRKPEIHAGYRVSDRGSGFGCYRYFLGFRCNHGCCPDGNRKRPGVSLRLLQAPASQVPTLVTRCLRCPIPQTWLRSRQAAHCMSISDICSTPLSQQPSFPLVVYAIVGMNADVSADITSDTVTTLLSQLSSMYSWNLLIIIPVVIVLGGPCFRSQPFRLCFFLLL